MLELGFIFDQGESTCSKRNVEEKGLEECDSYNLGTKEDPKMSKSKNIVTLKSEKVCFNFF